MPLNQKQLDEVFQTHGPVLSRLMRRQFPFMPDDVIDALVVETIARVHSRLKKLEEPISPAPLLSMLIRACRYRAIDHLRYHPSLTFIPSEDLDALSPPSLSDGCRSSARLVAELKSAISALDPSDREILQAAMSPPLVGDWARELALEQLRNEAKTGGLNGIDSDELARLCGRFRVRKHRLLAKLRRTLEANGIQVTAMIQE